MYIFSGGTPPHKGYLPAKQRWEVLEYLWTGGEEFKKDAIERPSPAGAKESGAAPAGAAPIF